MFRGPARAGLALAVIVVVALSGLIRDAAQATGQPPALDRTPCPENTALQCTALPVPIDWDHPHGATVDLALIRRPATDPASRIGSLVVHFGGSGTGVDDLLTPAFYHPGPQRARRFDIVAYDARGAGRSHSVRCSESLANQMEYQPHADPSPTQPQPATVAVGRAAAACNDATCPSATTPSSPPTCAAPRGWHPTSASAATPSSWWHASAYPRPATHHLP
jgi:hypothetical protein